jgi:hypothetical protein
MEAWGIIMTAFTLFGMLTLVITSLNTDDGTSAATLTERTIDVASETSDLKKAA